uniref:Uncharacterized protein n=1 Tax=Oryza nivara TaxID=4536 RepID=A0A0E0GZV8_ORYNI
MGVPKNRFPKVKTPDIDNTQVWSVNVPLGKVITRYPRGTDATGVPKFPAAKDPHQASGFNDFERVKL